MRHTYSVSLSLTYTVSIYIWVMPTKKSTPRPKLSKDAIGRAAIDIADAQGIDAVSMRATASALKVQAMSLYNHVQNKEALLDVMVELVTAEIELPQASVSWQKFVRQRCRAAYAMLQAHPWASALLLSRINTGPHMLRYVDATIGALIAAGFTYPQADHAWNAIDNHLYGFVLQEQQFPIAPDSYAVIAHEYLPQLAAMNLPYLTKMTQLVAERQYNGLHDFDFGLNLIIDGLERLLKSSNKK